MPPWAARAASGRRRPPPGRPGAASSPATRRRQRGLGRRRSRPELDVADFLVGGDHHRHARRGAEELAVDGERPVEAQLDPARPTRLWNGGSGRSRRLPPNRICAAWRTMPVGGWSKIVKWIGSPPLFQNGRVPSTSRSSVVASTRARRPSVHRPAVDADADLVAADAGGLAPRAAGRGARMARIVRGAGPAAGEAAGVDAAGAEMDAVIDAGGTEEHAALARPVRVVVDLEHAPADEMPLDLAARRHVEQPPQRAGVAAAEADIGRGHVGHAARQQRQRRRRGEGAAQEQRTEHAMDQPVAAVEHDQPAFPARRARPAAPGGPCPARSATWRMSGRPASTASMSRHAGAVALAERVAEHGGPAAAHAGTPSAPAPCQDALDQIEVGRLVDVDRRPRPSASRSRQPSRRAAARPAASPASRLASRSR